MSGSPPKHRWLMCGSFSPEPHGRRRPVSGERFATVMHDLDVGLELTLPATLGTKVGGPVRVQFDRPRTFRASELVLKIDALKRLSDLADAVAQNRDLTPSVVAARVEKIVGSNGLCTRLQPPAAPDPGPRPPMPEAPQQPTEAVREPTPTKAPAVAPTSGVDAIFAKVEAPITARAKNPLDAFISAVRSDSPAPFRVDRNVAGNLAETIRTETLSVAAALLTDSPLAELEASWRGLRMVLAEAPGHDHLALDLLDASATNLVAALEKHVHVEDTTCPDLIFIGLHVPEPLVQELATFAESRGVPIVLGLDDALGGEVARGIEGAEPQANWSELRARPSAGWICATSNDVVLWNEQLAGGDRVVFGSPAWGLAAILASSLKRNRTLRETVGRGAAVVSPGAVEAEIGFGEPRTIPTRTYADLSHQRRASQHGIVRMGSAPGSDQVLVVSNTMAGAGPSLSDRSRTSAGRRSS